jgi:hypothetical protein
VLTNSRAKLRQELTLSRGDHGVQFELGATKNPSKAGAEAACRISESKERTDRKKRTNPQINGKLINDLTV